MCKRYDISEIFSKMTEDPRVTVWHMGLFISILILWEQAGFSKQVRISRKKLMTKAHLGSITTYHKCIVQLCDFGYILYQPTYDCYKGSIIEIIL